MGLLKPTLAGITGTFTKTMRDLNTFINNSEDELSKHDKKIAELMTAKKDTISELEQAGTILINIKKLMGVEDADT